MSLDAMKSTIFGISSSICSVQSQLNDRSYNKFKSIAYSGTVGNYKSIVNEVAEVDLISYVVGGEVVALKAKYLTQLMKNMVS